MSKNAKEDNLIMQIRGNMLLKETDELLEIWWKHDQAEWSKVAFDVVHEILIERLGKIPRQKVQKVAKATSTRKITFKGIRTAGEIFRLSLAVLRKQPSLAEPLLMCWVIYAPIVLYLDYFFNWSKYSLSSVLLIVLAVITVFSLIIGISCLVLLELIEQIENGEEASILHAFSHVLRSSLIRALPILLVWAFLWFVIHVIATFFRRRNSSSNDEDFSAENAARTLAGLDSSWSFSSAFFDALNRGARMIVFLILPAIAWEELSPILATKKGLSILKSHIIEFSTGFVLSETTSFAVFLPTTILFFVTDKFNIVLPDGIWFVVIIYCALAWSFSLYIEQMFTAELYLWHLKWVAASNLARKNKKHLPDFRDITPPSILDDVPEFVKLRKVA